LGPVPGLDPRGRIVIKGTPTGISPHAHSLVTGGMMSYRSLVVGGAGFIGSHLAEHLLDMRHEVLVLDDLSEGFHKNVPSAKGSSKGRSRITSW
jgi:NAD dependent epimerase/dehydratase family